MATILGELGVKLQALTRDFSRDLKAAKKDLEGLQDVARTVGVAAGAAFAAGSVGIVKFLSAAGDVAETTSKLDAIFGGLTPSIQEFSKEFAEGARRSRFEIEEMVASTGALLKPILGSAEATQTFSQQVAKLAVDFASFNNATDAEAFTAIRAGLIGSSEPLQRFGVDLRIAALESFALSKGITTAVKDMTEQQRVTLRLQKIMSDQSDALGDAARTANSFANRLKGISGASSELAVELGQALLPAATRVLGVVQGLIEDFKGLSPEIKKAISFAFVGATAFAGIAAAMSGVAIILPSLIAGFALLRTVALTALLPLLPPILAIAAGIAGVILIVGALRQAWEGDLLGIQTFTSEVASKIGGFFDDLKKKITDFLDDVGEVTIQVAAFISGISPEETFKALQAFRRGGGAVGAVGGVVGDVGDALGPIVDATAETFKAIGRDLKKQMGGIVNVFGDGIDTFTDLLGDSGEEAAAEITQLADDIADAQDEAFDRLAETAFGAGDRIEGLGKAAKKTTETLEDVLLAGLQDLAVRAGDAVEGAFGVDLGNKVSSGLKAAFAVIGPAVQQGGEEINAAFSGAAQGFQAGGPFGALIGAVAGLLATTDGFKEIIQDINNSLIPVKEDLGKLTAAIAPLSKNFEVLVDVFNQVNKNMVGAGTILEIFAEVADVFSDIIRDATKAFAKTFNKVLNILKDFAGAVLFGAAERKVKKALESAKIKISDTSIDAIGAEDVEIPELTTSVGDATKEFESLATTTRELNQQFSNVPSGFKSAFGLFSATSRDPLDVLSGASEGRAAGGTIIVQVNDFEDFASKMTRDQRFRDFSFEGNSQSRGRFAVPRQGS